LYEEELKGKLIQEDPQSAVADLLREVCDLFQTERYTIVLPRNSLRNHKLEEEGKQLAATLIADHRGSWELKERKKQKGIRRRREPEPPR
jgi:hypothetical protein